MITASKCRTLARKICCRKSGVVSMITVVTARPASACARTITDERRRLFSGSVEREAWQAQPMTGTPTEVPLPRNSRLTFILGHARKFRLPAGQFIDVEHRTVLADCAPQQSGFFVSGQAVNDTRAADANTAGHALF